MLLPTTVRLTRLSAKMVVNFSAKMVNGFCISLVKSERFGVCFCSAMCSSSIIIILVSRLLCHYMDFLD